MKSRKVRDVMTKDVVWVRPQTPFRSIAELLARHNISAVPVVEPTHQVIGLVSEADLLDKYEVRAVEHRPPWWAPARRRLWRKAVATVAADLMTSPAITIGQDTDVVRASRTLVGKRLKRLPVVDGSDHLVGIVTRHDLVALFVRPDSEIHDEIREEVVVRALCMDPHGLTVEVEEGIVRLHGQVERHSMVPLAIRLAWAVDGVVDVVDELTYAVDDTHFDDGTAPSNVGVFHSLWERR